MIAQVLIASAGGTRREATVSECGRYRYSLRRVWDESMPLLVLCMVNPSTADALSDDATIRKCNGFARRLGCGGILVGNLYAYRATDPRDLCAAARRGDDVIGPDNDRWLRRLSEIARDNGGNRILCAWGSISARPKSIRERVQSLVLVAQATVGVRLECLSVTQDGNPGHPLMLPYDTADRICQWT